MEIDDTDRRLLNVLQRDASLGLEEIGAEIGLSRNGCWRRIKALEEAGILRGRVALVDPVKLGLGLMVVIQIRAATHTADWLTAFSRAVRAMPEIQSVYRMTGDLDYLLRARVADMAGYDRLYQRLIERVPLNDVSASFVMEELKDSHVLPL